MARLSAGALPCDNADVAMGSTERTDAVAQRTPRWPLVVVLAVALGVRLANLCAVSRLPIAEYQVRWAESDMETSWRWSSHILAGDVLTREPVYAYTSWMRDVAPRETWERWWGGRGVFFRAPLYAYVLAAMRLGAGDGYWGLALCHMVVALAGVLLVFLLAERFFGTWAAMAAGLGSALYGPSLLQEAFFLRDSLVVTCSLLMLWTLARTVDAAARRWLLAGVCLALGLLARETTSLFVPFVVLWAVQRFPPRRAVAALAAFAVGASIGLAPLMARNVALGVPFWALSNRGAEEFIIGHAAGTSPVGLLIPPELGSVMERSEGRIGAVIRLTLASHHGNWYGLLGQEFQHLRAILSRYEAADNVNWDYYAARSPVLRWSLRFDVVLALGLIGLWVPRRGDDRILRYFLLVSLGGLAYATVIGRYRLVFAAVLWPYAGAAAWWIVSAVAHRNWRRAGLALAGVGVALAVSATALSATETRNRWRATEFFVVTREYEARGQVAQALDELRDGLRTAHLGADQQRLPHGASWLAGELAKLMVMDGRASEVRVEIERLAAEYPADPNLQHLLGSLYGDILEQPDKAEEHFARERALRGQ